MGNGDTPPKGGVPIVPIIPGLLSPTSDKDDAGEKKKKKAVRT